MQPAIFPQCQYLRPSQRFHRQLTSTGGSQRSRHRGHRSHAIVGRRGQEVHRNLDCTRNVDHPARRSPPFCRRCHQYGRPEMENCRLRNRPVTVTASFVQVLASAVTNLLSAEEDLRSCFRRAALLPGLSRQNFSNSLGNSLTADVFSVPSQRSTVELRWTAPYPPRKSKKLIRP